MRSIERCYHNYPNYRIFFFFCNALLAYVTGRDRDFTKSCQIKEESATEMIRGQVCERERKSLKHRGSSEII